MPTYEYHCDGCGREFEIKQRISADPLTVCDLCGGHVRRLLSAAPFILKGEGWYVTDYPSTSRKQALESEKSGAKTPAADSEKSAPEKSAPEKSAPDKSAPAKSTPSSDGASTSSSVPSSPSSSSASSSD